MDLYENLVGGQVLSYELKSAVEFRCSKHTGNNNQEAILELYNVISKVKCFFLSDYSNKASYGTGEITKDFSPKMKFSFGGQRKMEGNHLAWAGGSGDVC